MHTLGIIDQFNMKYLINYNDSAVTSVAIYVAGTMVVTPFYFLVATLEDARTMLTALQINVDLIDTYTQ